ncbi:PIN domain-containing protein [Endozoicomonas sp. ALC020]|uniref:PIN domain-containing protein n=1 Tax=unclassified Endozoicomonas TaxID=2644528 RepID=UPI003BB14707
MIFPWMGNKHRLPIESEREQVLNALLSITQWVEIYYLWRPKLPDEADNHLVELAMADGASHIITKNIKDVGRGELRFDHLNVSHGKIMKVRAWPGQQPDSMCS